MWYYYVSLILLALSLFVSLALKSAFRKYSKVPANVDSITASQKILREANVDVLPIMPISGELTDNYNPTNKTLYLSENVYGLNTVAAVAVAAHECGHAIQDAQGYPLLQLRKKLVPIANFSSQLSYIVILLGIAFDLANFITVGAIIFSIIVVINLITLPVEIDASNRALKVINNLNLVDGSDQKGCNKVLRLAGMTYFIALLSSLLTLFRYLSIAKSRKRD